MITTILLGLDYSTTTTVLTFPSGVTQVSQTVATTTDNFADSGEMFTAILSNPSNGLALGAATTATATILDGEIL